MVDARLGKVDKERYSTPALGGKMRVGGMLLKDDITNIFYIHSFYWHIFKKLNLIDYKFNVKNSLKYLL